MSNTLRRKPWQWDAPAGKERWQKTHNDKTCQPGCGVCGKADWQRKENRAKMRRLGVQEIDSQLLGTKPPSKSKSWW
jgi:hypothetical protein